VGGRGIGGARSHLVGGRRGGRRRRSADCGPIFVNVDL